MNGQRPQTPGENAPSPSKRPRLEGAGFDGQAMMNRQVSANQQAGGMGAAGGQPMMQNGQLAGFGPTGGAPLKMEVSITMLHLCIFVFEPTNISPRV